MDIWVCGFNRIVQKRCWIWWGLQKCKWIGKEKNLQKRGGKGKKKRQKGELVLGSTQGRKISSEERLQELVLVSLGREDWEGIPLIPKISPGGVRPWGRQELLSSWTFLIIPVCGRNAALDKAQIQQSSTSSGFPSPLQDFEVGNIDLCSGQNRAI